MSLIEVLDADSNLLQVQDAKAQAQTEAARAAIASFGSGRRMSKMRIASATVRSSERSLASD